MQLRRRRVTGQVRDFFMVLRPLSGLVWSGLVNLRVCQWQHRAKPFASVLCTSYAVVRHGHGHTFESLPLLRARESEH